jgi:hypothetical protein
MPLPNSVENWIALDESFSEVSLARAKVEKYWHWPVQACSANEVQSDNYIISAGDVERCTQGTVGAIPYPAPSPMHVNMLWGFSIPCLVLSALYENLLMAKAVLENPVLFPYPGKKNCHSSCTFT